MPDYYLRYRNRVFVFGCKDVQMAAKIKLSGDYETIKKHFLRSMSQIPRGMRKEVAVGKYDWQKACRKDWFQHLSMFVSA